MTYRLLSVAFAGLLVAGAASAAPITAVPNTQIKQPDTSDNGQQNGPNSRYGPASSFQVSYASNFNQGAVNVRVMNTGAAGGVGDAGYICVNMYVFNTSQTMQSCCTCLISPNALATLPVQGIFSNPMVIKLLATYPNNAYGPTPGGTYACNATVPVTGAAVASGTLYQFLAPGMAAWTDSTPFQSPTHFQVRFEQSVFSAGEAASLASKCLALGPPTTCASCPVEQDHN